ncbi:MAG: hypothetical protein QHH30_06170 [candidate division NC10 bacterium]|nr:hypothetical protein [candidate division NC10 bacterium]
MKFKGAKTHPGLGPAAEQAVQASLPREARQALGRVGHIQGIVPSLGLFCIRIHPGLSAGEAIEALYRSGAVEYAEPNYQIRLQATPNDTYFSNQWGLHNTGQAGGDNRCGHRCPRRLEHPQIGHGSGGGGHRLWGGLQPRGPILQYVAEPE